MRRSDEEREDNAKKAENLAILADIALTELGEDPAVAAAAQEMRGDLEGFQSRNKPVRHATKVSYESRLEIADEPKKPRKVGSRAKLSKEASGECLRVCF